MALHSLPEVKGCAARSECRLAFSPTSQTSGVALLCASHVPSSSDTENPLRVSPMAQLLRGVACLPEPPCDLTAHTSPDTGPAHFFLESSSSCHSLPLTERSFQSVGELPRFPQKLGECGARQLFLYFELLTSFLYPRRDTGSAICVP